MEYPLFETQWLLAGLGLYVFVGCCWLPVVWIQIRLREMAEVALESGESLPPEFRRRMRVWTALGVPAFTGVFAIFALMIIRPEF